MHIYSTILQIKTQVLCQRLDRSFTRIIRWASWRIRDPLLTSRDHDRASSSGLEIRDICVEPMDHAHEIRAQRGIEILCVSPRAGR